MQLLLLLCFVAAGLGLRDWVEQGPAPLKFANQAVNDIGDRRETGGVNDIAFDPNDPNILYAATVSGGLWKTTKAKSIDPSWTPLTDHLPDLSTLSIAVSPVNSQTIYAGTGLTSSTGGDGSNPSGVLRSTDGGKTWVTGLGLPLLRGNNIVDIIPTSLPGSRPGQFVVLVATQAPNYGQSRDPRIPKNAGTDFVLPAFLIQRPLVPVYGVYRSTDDGQTWTALSGGASGLPIGGVSSMVADPSMPTRFFAAVLACCTSGSTSAVYRSEDGGLTWSRAGNANFSDSPRILLAIGHDGTIYAWAMQYATEDRKSYRDYATGPVMRSVDAGNTWTTLPAPEVLPSILGTLSGALAVDPHDSDVIFAAGDEQLGTGSCPIACGIIKRLDVKEGVWVDVMCAGAGGTCPHEGSRSLHFDAQGDLVMSTGGSISRLKDPNHNATRHWVSVNGNLGVTEVTDVQYDPVSKVLFGGAQDGGSFSQATPENKTSLYSLFGSGGHAALDSDQVAHPGISIRYFSTQLALAVVRYRFDTENHPLSCDFLNLQIVSGVGANQPLSPFDSTQFYPLLLTNVVDPSRLLVGTRFLYESMDKGDTLVNLLPSPGYTSLDAVYGGFFHGSPRPGVFYVVKGALVLHRVSVGGPIKTIVNPGGVYAWTITTDPNNYRRVFLGDVQGSVWMSENAGTSFSDITANLPEFLAWPRDILAISTSTNLVLLAAGLGGVWQMNVDSSQRKWTAVPAANSLPHVVFNTLRYNQQDDVLVVGSIGRGVWTLRGQFAGHSQGQLPPPPTYAGIGFAPFDVCLASPTSATMRTTRDPKSKSAF